MIVLIEPLRTMSKSKSDAIKLLTPLEEKLLDSLKQVATVKMAAHRIGIKPKTAYNVLYRLRKKYVAARHFVNYIDAQKRRHDKLAMVLTDRMQCLNGE
jgi:Mn-dependent DtxR family transcriptional regulator